MNKQLKFIVLSALLIVSRIYDVLTTYLYIPDLKGETNVLVKLLGAGWFSVILIQSLLVGVIIYAWHYYVFRYKALQPVEKNLSLKQYISFLHFKDTSSFHKLLTSFPKNKYIVLASLGFIATHTLIVAGFVVGISTTALLLSEDYREIYRHGIPLCLYLFIIIMAGYFTLKFYKQEYNHYRKISNESPGLEMPL